MTIADFDKVNLRSIDDVEASIIQKYDEVVLCHELMSPVHSGMQSIWNYLVGSCGRISKENFSLAVLQANVETNSLLGLCYQAYSAAEKSYKALLEAHTNAVEGLTHELRVWDLYASKDGAVFRRADSRVLQAYQMYKRLI